MDFLTILIAIAAAFAIFVFALKKINQKKQQNLDEKFALLSIKVSKENENGPIVAEQIFAAVHNVKNKKKLFGQPLSNKISFEIANISESIRFYVWTPEYLKNTIKSQIYAQYPDVEIFEVEDYTNLPEMEISPPAHSKSRQPEKHALVETGKPIEKESLNFKKVSMHSNSVGAELSLSEPSIYPIKRYSQFEDRLTRIAVDPIAGITEALAKLESPNEQIWLQIVIQPLEKKWRTIYRNCARILQKRTFMGIEAFQNLYTRAFCSRNQALRFIFFPIYIAFWFEGLTAGSKTKSVSQRDATVKDMADPFKEEVSGSHDKETPIQAATDKVLKMLFDANIRLIYLPKTADASHSDQKLREIAAAFKQFHIPYANGFEISKLDLTGQIVEDYRHRKIQRPFILNNEELATIYHLPNETVSTPNIYRVTSRKLEPPIDAPTVENSKETDFTLLGKTNFRTLHKEFGIRSADRRRHLYIIGKTGMGKSTLLENMIFSDIQAGRGVGLVDPHGDTAEKILDFIPHSRTNDVIIFDPSDVNHPIPFNMLENQDPALNSIVASGLVGVFKKLYADSWGPRLEHILRNTILALLEYPNTSMLGITRMLQDSVFRKRVIRKITDPIVKSFWENEFEKMQERQRTEAISPILNKVGQFLSSPIVRNIVGQPHHSINLRFAMDKGKIIIVNLSKGKIGEDNSALLGSMLITKFQLDAMSRSDIPEHERKDFYLYVDEFQNFATESFATILSEARKYRLNLTMANQYIAQMPDEVRDAVFGNVGSMISFQVGFDDAEYLAQQFGGEKFITENDLVGLSKYTAYIKLLIDGMPSKVFSIDTLPPPDVEQGEGRNEIVRKVSRERYTVSRNLVEERIKKWSENTSELGEAKNFKPEAKKYVSGDKNNQANQNQSQKPKKKPQNRPAKKTD